MSASTGSGSSDRNLLFGILALQMDFVQRDALIAAMHAWVLDKTKPLGQILHEQGRLTADLLQVLELVVAKHLQAHKDDVQASLSSIPPLPSLQQELQDIADDDVQASLSLISSKSNSRDQGTIQYTPAAHAAEGLRYRVLRPYAKGGLGEVFVAEDQELKREVALKEIREEFAHDPDSRGRFLLEGEITGGLEHPGIVPVYGLGQYDDGRPYYAMRFIKGDNLKQAIKHFHQKDTAPRNATKRNVAFRDLLGRFVDVCNAVAYAHSRGILHRDLKPGNIMLGKYGETLLVDWGLAKPVGREETFAESDEVTLRPNSSDSSMAETHMGTALGTPGFMSPEQAAGRLDKLGPASDIYSLGATLYALLTGDPPFQGETGSILTAVQKGDFKPPRQVNAKIPAALEAICLKAMALKPEHRYASVLELAEDVEHWLADEPVAAWPEPMTVKMGRWVRNHKPLVTGAAAALLVGLLALGGGAFWYQQEQTRRAAALAQTEQGIRDVLKQAQRLRNQLQKELRQTGGVFRLLDGPSRWEGQLKQARAILDRAKSLPTGSEGEIDPQLVAQIKALDVTLKNDEADRKMAQRLEEIHLERYVVTESEYDFATLTGEYPKAFHEAKIDVLGASDQKVATTIKQSPIKEQLVTALDDWAYRARYALEDKNLMKRLLRVAKLADPDPWKDEFRDAGTWENPKKLKNLMDRANMDRLSPQMSAFFTGILRRNGVDRVAWARKAQAHYPSDFWVNFNLAFTIRDKEPQEAEGFYRVALAARPRSVNAYNSLGWTFYLQGKYSEAIATYKIAISLQPNFSRSYINLGDVYQQQNKTKDALKYYLKAYELAPTSACGLWALGNSLRLQKKYPEAIATLKKATAADPKYTSAYNTMGNIFRKLGEWDNAISAYQKAIEADKLYFWGHANLARAYYDKKNYPLAMKHAKIASEIRPSHIRPHLIIANVLAAQNKSQEAIEILENALEQIPPNATAYSNLGIGFQHLGATRRAATAFKKAIKLDPKNADAHTNLGVYFFNQNNMEDAYKNFKTAIELNPQLFQAHMNLGNVLSRKNDHKGAIAAYKTAIELKPKLALTYHYLGQMLVAQSKFAEALKYHQRAVEIGSTSPYWQNRFKTSMQTCQYYLNLDRRWEEVRRGEFESPNGAVDIVLANFSYSRKKHYRMAVRLYRSAFKRDPWTVNNLRYKPSILRRARCGLGG